VPLATSVSKTVPTTAAGGGGGGGEGKGKGGEGGEDVALVVVTHASSIATNLWEECGEAFGARDGAMRRSYILIRLARAGAPPAYRRPFCVLPLIPPLPLAEWSGVA
jgi:hypothetical protein